MEWELSKSGIERVGVQVICGSLESITMIRRSEIAEEELVWSRVIWESAKLMLSDEGEEM